MSDTSTSGSTSPQLLEGGNGLVSARPWASTNDSAGWFTIAAVELPCESASHRTLRGREAPTFATAGTYVAARRRHPLVMLTCGGELVLHFPRHDYSVVAAG
jgi:hypothetical protein